MIDTLMVLWTSGTWKRPLRTIGAALIVLTCICLLLFLIMVSGGKWSGLAVTVTQPGTTPAHVQPIPAQTTVSVTTPYIVPVILQNPIPTQPAVPTEQPIPTQPAVPTEQPIPAQASRNYQTHISHHRMSRHPHSSVPIRPAPTPNRGPAGFPNILANFP